MRTIAPWFGLSEKPAADKAADKTVVVVGCPFGSRDAFRSGAQDGPAAIREWARTCEAINELGHPVDNLCVVDCGDVAVQDDFGEGRWEAIEKTAARALADHPDAFLLGLGGDHAVTPPLAAAARKAHGDLGFVLLDAHADCFDDYEGNPLSHACVVSRVWDRAGYDRDKTCIAGVRSYAFEELEVMNTAGLVIPARPWLSLGAEALATEIKELTEGIPLYISLDIDLLDPSAAPGTGYPVAGGPGTRDVLSLLAEIFRMQPVAAMDLVEVAPEVDPTGITAATAAHILLQVFGHVAGGD